MSCVWTILLAFIAFLFFSISAPVHGDCASCCHGKWSQCFSSCEDMVLCSECTEEKETCIGNCPGSCSLKSAASISSSSLRRAFVKVSNLKMHKFQRRLRKFVKRMNRRQIAWECNYCESTKYNKCRTKISSLAQRGKMRIDWVKSGWPKNAFP